MTATIPAGEVFTYFLTEASVSVKVSVLCAAKLIDHYRKTEENRGTWMGKQGGFRCIHREPYQWVRNNHSANLVYPTSHYSQQNRVPISIFRRVWEYLRAHYRNACSTQDDAIGRQGIRGEVRLIVCLRLLGHDRSFQDLYHSSQMAKNTIRRYFHLFVRMFERYTVLTYLTAGLQGTRCK